MNLLFKEKGKIQQTTEIKCSFQNNVRVTWYQYDWSLVILSLIIWLRQCLQGFFIFKVTIFFYAPFVRNKLLNLAHIKEERNWAVPPGGRSIKQSMDICLKTTRVINKYLGLDNLRLQIFCGLCLQQLWLRYSGGNFLYPSFPSIFNISNFSVRKISPSPHLDRKSVVRERV